MRVFASLLREITKWDAASKAALAINLVLLVIALYTLNTQPDLQTPAVVALVGLVISLQVIVLWGNRRLVTPYTQAQRHFLAGEFGQARDVLEAHIEELQAQEKQPDVDLLVLLGNTYRNLGQLDESEVTLRAALERQANYHFALYGLGKTLLAQGRYNNAAQAFETGLKHGAYAVTKLDLAHTYYRTGNHEAIPALLSNADFATEAHRELFAQYLLYQVVDHAAPADRLIRDGLPFWAAEKERFSHTPYGQDLQSDLQTLKNLL